MPPTPRQTIEPSFIQDLDCPICGEDALRLKSMERYPDYVACANCSSQFVAEEGGERVMYGEIPRAYPRTSQFALQQWAWPEAIARRAAEERSEAAAEPTSQPPGEPAGQESDKPEPASPPDQPSQPPAPQAPTDAPSQPSPSADVEPTVEEPELADEPEPPSFQEEPPPTSTEDPPVEPAQSTPAPAPEPAAEAPEEPEPPTFEAEPSEPVTPGEPAPDDGAFEAELEPPPWQPPEGTEAEAPEAAEPEVSQEALDEEFDEEEDWLPPFGEAPEEEEGAELPEDFEPAPEMPDWLAREEPEESADIGTSHPPVAEEGQADEDLAAALWEQEGAEAEDEEPLTPDRDQTEERQFASEFMSELEAERAEESGEEAPGARPPKPEAEEYTQEELAAMLWTGEARPETKTEAEGPPGEHATEPAMKRPESGAAPQEAAPPREPIEPEPGLRHRVVLKTSQPNLPEDMCAHCTQTPTVAKLPVRAALYRGTGVGERQMATFHVPICADCRARVNAHSDEQQTARLQAHLISVLVALFLVVGALGFRVVDFQDTVLVDLAILVVLALMGYIVPVAVLLLRASRFTKPPDARYVATTMRVPSDTEGLETAYEWRSPEYASHFLQANSESATGGVTKVKERQYESRETEQPPE